MKPFTRHARQHPKVSAGTRRPYLEETVNVRVRFQEVDAMGIVWHGHYLAWFEEARRAFGRRFDLDYPAFFEQKVVAPLVHVQVDFLRPAQMTDEVEVTARLCQTDAAKLDFLYEVRRLYSGELLATGGSTQVFTTPEGELLLQLPPFIVERFQTWENLWIPPS